MEEKKKHRTNNTPKKWHLTNRDNDNNNTTKNNKEEDENMNARYEHRVWHGTPMLVRHSTDALARKAAASVISRARPSDHSGKQSAFASSVQRVTGIVHARSRSTQVAAQGGPYQP